MMGSGVGGSGRGGGGGGGGGGGTFDGRPVREMTDAEIFAARSNFVRDVNGAERAVFEASRAAQRNGVPREEAMRNYSSDIAAARRRVQARYEPLVTEAERRMRILMGS